MVVGGVLIENPPMIGVGIPIATDGVVSTVIEFGLGGNTSNVPLGTTEMSINIGKGIYERYK